MSLRIIVVTGLILTFAGLSQAMEPVKAGNSVDELMAAVGGKSPVDTSGYKPQRAVKSPKGPTDMPRAKLSSVNNRIETTSRSSLRPVGTVAKPSHGNRPFSRPAAAAAPLNSPLKPNVKAKALFCVDCSSNKVMLAENISQPLPIASITKLLTAMTVLDNFKLDQVIEVPGDITEVEKHNVGIRPGDSFTVRDLLHGMLIESGNDCAETLAGAYTKGGRDGFVTAMNAKAARLGAINARLFTSSGLDMKMIIGKKHGRILETRRPNTASASEVALIARNAFKNPVISEISSMKRYTMHSRSVSARDYPLFSNDRLLSKDLPVAGAKTGYTNMAGRCIVALFKHENAEHMVVVLNTLHHFKAAERIYRWANRHM